MTEAPRPEADASRPSPAEAGSTTRRLRLAFAGTPDFAKVALAALHEAGFDIALVLTQPDRPAGRGLKLQPSAVKSFASTHSIRVIQPAGLRLDGKYASDAQAARLALQSAKVDLIVVAAYGLILPGWVLDLPPLGCLNIHGSLLPRWRGAAPVHRAIEAGDTTTGITVMQMDAGLDTGAMLLMQAMLIGPRDTTGSLHDRLAALGGRLIVEAVRLAAAGALRPVAQPADGVTYAKKIDKAEASIDWNLAAEIIERRMRAFDPSPGASAMLGGQLVKCWSGEIVVAEGSVPAPAGTIVAVDAAGIVVACGPGPNRLRLSELQKAGGKRVPAAQLAAAMGWVEGMSFQPRATAAD